MISKRRKIRSEPDGAETILFIIRTSRDTPLFPTFQGEPLPRVKWRIKSIAGRGYFLFGFGSSRVQQIKNKETTFTFR